MLKRDLILYIAKARKEYLARLLKSDFFSPMISRFNIHIYKERERINIPCPCTRDEATYSRYMLARVQPPHPQCQLF